MSTSTGGRANAVSRRGRSRDQRPRETVAGRGGITVAWRERVSVPFAGSECITRGASFAGRQWTDPDCRFGPRRLAEGLL